MAIATSENFRELAPSQIVPILAEDGVYVASESSFYRVLRVGSSCSIGDEAASAEQSPRGARGDRADQVWSWDITYLRSALRGQYFYLYLVVDVWSRKIVAWEVATQE